MVFSTNSVHFHLSYSKKDNLNTQGRCTLCYCDYVSDSFLISSSFWIWLVMGGGSVLSVAMHTGFNRSKAAGSCAHATSVL